MLEEYLNFSFSSGSLACFSSISSKESENPSSFFFAFFFRFFFFSFSCFFRFFSKLETVGTSAKELPWSGLTGSKWSVNGTSSCAGFCASGSVSEETAVCSGSTTSSTGSGGLAMLSTSVSSIVGAAIIPWDSVITSSNWWDNVLSIGGIRLSIAFSVSRSASKSKAGSASASNW